jgi:hypothetical protein
MAIARLVLPFVKPGACTCYQTLEDVMTADVVIVSLTQAVHIGPPRKRTTGRRGVRESRTSAAD